MGRECPEYISEYKYVIKDEEEYMVEKANQEDSKEDIEK